MIIIVLNTQEATPALPLGGAIKVSRAGEGRLAKRVAAKVRHRVVNYYSLGETNKPTLSGLKVIILVVI